VLSCRTFVMVVPWTKSEIKRCPYVAMAIKSQRSACAVLRIARRLTDLVAQRDLEILSPELLTDFSRNSRSSLISRESQRFRFSCHCAAEPVETCSRRISAPVKRASSLTRGRRKVSASLWSRATMSEHQCQRPSSGNASFPASNPTSNGSRFSIPADRRWRFRELFGFERLKACCDIPQPSFIVDAGEIRVHVFDTAAPRCLCQAGGNAEVRSSL
jgi:hypothetical protein